MSCGRTRGSSSTKCYKSPRTITRKKKKQEIRRIRAAGVRIKDDVLVIFVNLESRDFIMGFARNLAEAVDREGNPLARLRMDIPVHLMSVFRLLENHGLKMKKKYGRDFKRHIRYDDSDQSPYLNVRIPGETTWTRIGPEYPWQPPLHSHH